MGGSANQQDKSLTRTYRVRDNKNNIKKKKAADVFLQYCAS